MSLNESFAIQSESTDPSTFDVCDWLHYLDCRNVNLLLDEVRITEAEIHIGPDRNSVSFNGRTYAAAPGRFWYRRGQLKLSHRFPAKHQFSFTGREDQYVLSHINAFLGAGRAVNRFSDNSLNKLTVLSRAQQLGLDVPETLVTNSKQACNRFMKGERRILTKAIHIPHFSGRLATGQEVEGALQSVLIDTADLARRLSDRPGQELDGYILLQKYVEKVVEVRSFYLDGSFRSMAIFSQQNEKTKFDFRNYDYDRPNRLVPYRLPPAVEEKLARLMQELNLTSGSIDLIVTPEKRYCFLEVNPIGQFQWLSRNCNYFIERMIAQQLLGE